MPSDRRSLACSRDSTLMTLAPMSASSMVQKGMAITCPRSSTVTSLNAFSIAVPYDVSSATLTGHLAPSRYRSCATAIVSQSTASCQRGETPRGRYDWGAGASALLGRSCFYEGYTCQFKLIAKADMLCKAIVRRVGQAG